MSNVYQHHGRIRRGYREARSQLDRSSARWQRRRPGHQPAPALHALHAHRRTTPRPWPAARRRRRWLASSASRPDVAADAPRAGPHPQPRWPAPSGEDAKRAAAHRRPPSSASSRAWPSTAASGTRPALPTRWASWASCCMDAGQMREAIAAFTEALEIVPTSGQPGKVGHRPGIPGQRPRAPGPVRRRPGEVPAGVGVVAAVRFAAAASPSSKTTSPGCRPSCGAGANGVLVGARHPRQPVPGRNRLRRP